jgi:hypothetical protein
LARDGERVLVLQPTKELIDKTIQNELLSAKGPPRHHVFHGDNVDGAVASAITTHFNAADAEGQIVFATHAVLSYVPYWANKRDWHVFIDEELQVVRHNCHQLPRTHSIITDHIELEPYNSIYGRVMVRDLEELREKGRNRDEDELLGQVAEVSRTLTNPRWDSFINTEHFEKLKNGQSKRLSVHSILKPSVIEGFGSVLIAGANFQESQQYRLWSDEGIRFKEDTEFVADLRFQSHPNGHLIDIYLAMENPWSKKRREIVGGDGQDNNLLRITRASTTLFGNAAFVWQANKAVPDNLFGPNAERLPNKPHGLNSYAGIHNIAFLSALNPAPEHFRFLETLGLSGEDVRDAVYHATAYQAVMRISIRDTNNPDRKIIVVPDRALAEYLQSRFPGSGIHKLDCGIVEDAKPRKSGRPRKHRSNKVRVAEQRARAKAETLRILNEQISLSFAPDHSAGGLQSGCAEKGIEPYTNFGTPACSGSLYPAKTSSVAIGYLHDDGDSEFFVTALKAFSRHSRDSKDGYALISPSVFDPGKVKDTKRGLDNIVYTRHLWLDFEDGDLTPEELAALFPNVRLVVMNSFHHRSDKPRFRAVFLTDRPLTKEAYELLFDNVARKIEEAEYCVNRKKKTGKRTSTGIRQAGLDWSKRTPASLFYLPSQAADPSQSFFIDFNGPERQILNPLPWIEHSLVPVVPPHDLPTLWESDGTEINEALVQEATNVWRQSTLFPGEGNARFWQFALALGRAGRNLNQIQSTLQAEAQFGRSPKKRRAQVKSIINSLRQTRRKAI